jgi:predicted nucleic acid-binding Zn ribbon protein
MYFWPWNNYSRFKQREKNMKLRWLWAGIVIVMMLCLTIGVTRAQEKSYSADRFDVEITVEEGGSLLVTETIDFDFAGGPFTYVFRELPTDLTDGISVLEASVDGVGYPVGENPGQVEISTGNPMRITWHLEPTSDATRTVALTYRADGVVRQEQGTDALYWQVLPDSYDYFISENDTVVNYPSRSPLVSEPTVLAGTAVTSQSADLVTFTANNLQPNSPFVFKLQFEEGSLISALPTWQVEQQAEAERQAARKAQIPYWLGLAILLFGVGFTAMVIYRRRHITPSIKTKLTVMEPPGKLPPGMAGILVGGDTSPQWTHAQGTMFSLAEQGVLIIEELPDKKWYRKHNFVVKQIDQVANLKPHEEGFLQMLFTGKNGRTTSIKMSDMGKKISGSAWKKYKEPLQEEMEQAGFLSESRRKTRSTLFGFGVLLLILGIAGLIGTALLSSVVGFGPWALAAAATLLGFTGFILGGSLSSLSDVGAESAVSWKAFNNYLKEVSKGKQSIDNPALFDEYLPYVAAFGMLHQWAKQFEKEGWTETPTYFHVLPATTGNQAMIAFIAMTAATNSSGGSAAGAGAGAAGAGAAGGGASGAG